MKKFIVVVLSFVLAVCFSCDDDKKDTEPKEKECDKVYTEEVYVVCCGMTGPGGLPAGSDCKSYSYCIEKIICKKPD